MNLLFNKQLFIFIPFQSTKNRKKEMCEENNVEEIIGDVYCPICRNEKFVYISIKKLPVSETQDSAKPALTC